MWYQSVWMERKTSFRVQKKEKRKGQKGKWKCKTIGWIQKPILPIRLRLCLRFYINFYFNLRLWCFSVWCDIRSLAFVRWGLLPTNHVRSYCPPLLSHAPLFNVQTSPFLCFTYHTVFCDMNYALCNSKIL